MLENIHPALPPKGSAPNMQQVTMADLEPALCKASDLSCQQSPNYKLSRHNTIIIKGQNNLDVPYKAPIGKKHGKP